MTNQTAKDVIELYNKRAKRYNFSSTFIYNILGLRVNFHRKKAVEALQLKPGDTVVEIGCGTGGNFPFIQKTIGKNGRILGIDLTASMLREAELRIRNKDWDNVELIQADAANYRFNQNVDGILSTFALTMLPEYEQIILNGCNALSQNGKWVVMDFKAPDNWLSNFTSTLVFLVRPFGGTIEMADRHPWESLKKYTSNFYFKKFWFGMAYIASGQKKNN